MYVVFYNLLRTPQLLFLLFTHCQISVQSCLDNCSSIVYKSKTNNVLSFLLGRDK